MPWRFPVAQRRALAFEMDVLDSIAVPPATVRDRARAALRRGPLRAASWWCRSSLRMITDPVFRRREIGLWRECLMEKDVRERVNRRQERAIGDAELCQHLAAVLGRTLPARRGRSPRAEAMKARVSL